MFIKVFVFALFAAAFARNPNPCENAAAEKQKHVNDFTTCEDYFYCKGLTPINVGPCGTGRVFDQEQQSCVLAATCEECPPVSDPPRPFAVRIFD
jgi:hypothetical protein